MGYAAMTELTDRLSRIIVTDAQGVSRRDVVQLARDCLEEISALKGAKKKREKAAANGTRGTRLPADWAPDELYAKQQGLRPHEIAREAEKFRDYWRAAPGQKGVKLDWAATWRTWCRNAAERLGRAPIVVAAQPTAGPVAYDAATWTAIMRRFGRESAWSPEYGPPPGAPGCMVPPEILRNNNHRP